MTESGLDAFDERGFYRYPEDRPLALALGIGSLGRRSLEAGGTLAVGTGPEQARFRQRSGSKLSIRKARRFSPLRPPGMSSRPVVSSARAASSPSAHSPASGTRELVTKDSRPSPRQTAAKAGTTPALEVSPTDGELVQWRSGLSGGVRLLFVTAEKPVDHISVRGPSALLHGRTISFLVGGGADHPSYST